MIAAGKNAQQVSKQVDDLTKIKGAVIDLLK
jgi:hypothetical protein